jgi:putative hydrolase of the HAD superfamily
VSPPPNTRAVIFDYGHTLLDFAPAEDNLLECYSRVREMLTAEASRDLPEASQLVEALSRRVVAMVEESYRNAELEELDIVNLFATALRSLGLDLRHDLIRQIAEMEHRALVSRLVVPPENLEVLKTLRDTGLRIGLVSNAHFLPELMREDVERLGIAQYVDDAVFSAEIGVRKPHPAIFLKVLKELGVQPAEAIFVGDRVRDDIGGAKGLGMRGVLTRQFRREEVGDGAVPPDRIIERLPELVPYVRSQL